MRSVALLLSLLSLSTIFACSKTKKVDERSGGPTRNLSVTMTGLRVGEQELESPGYFLVCDGREELAGTIQSQDLATLVTFGEASLEDGTECHLEVRAIAKERIEWLTTPAKEGLYYVSSEGKVQSNSLELVLFKVFRFIGAVPAPLMVAAKDGGLCERFDMAKLACDPEQDPVDPIDPVDPTDPADPTDPSDPVTPPTQDDAALVAEKLGFVLEDVASVDGTAIRVKEVRADSLAATAGLLAQDELLLVETEEAKTSAEAYAAIRKAIDDAAISEIMLNVVSSGAARSIWIDLTSAH